MKWEEYIYIYILNKDNNNGKNSRWNGRTDNWIMPNDFLIYIDKNKLKSAKDMIDIVSTKDYRSLRVWTILYAG